MLKKIKKEKIAILFCQKKLKKLFLISKLKLAKLNWLDKVSVSIFKFGANRELFKFSLRAKFSQKSDKRSERCLSSSLGSRKPSLIEDSSLGSLKNSLIEEGVEGSTTDAAPGERAKFTRSSKLFNLYHLKGI